MYLKTLEENHLGRDFVVGDIHGQSFLLRKLLAYIAFDPDRDRMISVGDLIDRGPDSMGVLDFLKEPWFHAVQGNHEQMMLGALAGETVYWMSNGGEWAREYRNKPTAEFEAAVKRVQDLPHIITVKVDGRKFHVIHAEMPSRLTLNDETLADEKYVADIALNNLDAELAWGRRLFARFSAYAGRIDDSTISAAAGKGSKIEKIAGLSHVISGHTIVRTPVTAVGRTNIDTGAFLCGEEAGWPALTCVNLSDWTFHQVNLAEWQDGANVKPVVLPDQGAQP